MKRIKTSSIAKGIEVANYNAELVRKHAPQMGDLALFEVLSLGKHKAIQSGDGRHIHIFPGDRILAAFGNRYATNQFEGYVPEGPSEFCQLIGQGGVAGVLQSMHARYDDIGPTELRLVAYATDASGEVINTRFYGRARPERLLDNPSTSKIFLSLGASMDSGKTTTAAFLSRSLMLEGRRVAFIKLTGTVYSKDRCLVQDCGAAIAVDFSLCGYPSTYLCTTEEILAIYTDLLAQVATVNPDVIIVEIADGLLQRETYALLSHPGFMETVSGVVLSCPDSLSVSGGLDILDGLNLSPVFLSGLFTASPLMVQEVQRFTNLPVFGLADFVDNPSRVEQRVLSYSKVRMIAI